MTQTAKKHALLGASSASRWLTCTPSARLTESMGDLCTPYAQAGTLAHEICELKLRKAYIEQMSARTYNAKLKKLQAHELYQEEMLRCADEYIDYISETIHGYTSPPYVAAEKRVDYSRYVPEGFGTADCVIIGGQTLHVIDYKHGQGVPVNAVDNPQLKLYALGATIAYEMLYNIETVKVAIVQPRAGGITEWETTTAALTEWAESIRPVAQMAYDGKGEFAPGENTCRFCRAKTVCRARGEYYLAMESAHKAKPPVVSNDEVGDYLNRARGLAAWVKDLEEYALAECLAGREVAGWKAVEGRSSRAFSNTDAAFAHLIQTGTPKEILYERKPITLTKVEQLLGKPKFGEMLSDYLVKLPGKPALVPASGKRDPYQQPTAAEDFAEDAQAV